MQLSAGDIFREHVLIEVLAERCAVIPWVLPGFFRNNLAFRIGIAKYATT